MPSRVRLLRAFTLVEILIVVVILGILAALVVPQFSSATADAQRVSTYDQLQKIRKALHIYYVRAGNVWPNITTGNGTWGELLTTAPPYLREPPENTWVGGSNAERIIVSNTPDAAYHTGYGWIWDPTTGDVWAAGYDGDDEPLPRP